MIMGAGLSGKAYFLYANQAPTLVLADLQTCSNKYVPSNSGNISVGHGHDWGDRRHGGHPLQHDRHPQ